MSKKIILNIFIIIIISCLVFIPAGNSFGRTELEKELGASYGDFKLTAGESEEFNEMVNIIVHIVQVIGSITSVIVLMVIGIKYMIGSIEERAEYKKTMVPYVIGAVMVFAISTVTGIIYSIAKNIF